MKKAVLGGLAGAVVLGAIALGVLYRNLNALVKRAVEEYAPELIGVPVRLSSVHLMPFSGAGTLKDLVIGNPPGFKSEHAVKVARVHVKLDPKSVLRDTVVVNRVEVDGPDIVYEHGPGGSNLSRIQRGLQGPAPSGRQAQPSKKVIIERFDLTNGKVRLLAGRLTPNPVTADLPDLHLRDIGKSKGGATWKEAASQVVGPLTRSATDVVAQVGKSVEDAVKRTKGAVEKTLKGFFKR